jgi:hypothetical protein
MNGSKMWQLASLVIPALLTGWLTFMFWGIEQKVKAVSEKQQAILSTHLAITEDVYKRRLTAYENADTQMTLLEDALQNLQPNATNNPAFLNRQAADALTTLSALNKMNKLYMSEKVGVGVGDLWWAGTEFFRGKRTKEEVAQKIAELEKQMKADIQPYVESLK